MFGPDVIKERKYKVNTGYTLLYVSFAVVYGRTI